VPTAAKPARRPAIFLNIRRREPGFASGASDLGTSVSVFGSSVVMSQCVRSAEGDAVAPEKGGLNCTKREFGSFAGVLRPKVRDRYADESDALGRREDGPDQAKGDLVQPVPGFNARFH
jgi:hypothetical protein